MTKTDLVKLDTLLAAFQRHIDAKHPLNPAFDRAAKVRGDVDTAIARLTEQVKLPRRRT